MLCPCLYLRASWEDGLLWEGEKAAGVMGAVGWGGMGAGGVWSREARQRAPGVRAEHTPYCVRHGTWASLSKFSFIPA